MLRTPVSSTNIMDVGYEKNNLYLRFHSGKSYRYDNVPESVYYAMTRAESVGRFFHRFVRNRYQYTCLNSDPFIH